jgi:hypothetical protein
MENAQTELRMRKVHGLERKICNALFEMTDKTIAHSTLEGRSSSRVHNEAMPSRRAGFFFQLIFACIWSAKFRLTTTWVGCTRRGCNRTSLGLPEKLKRTHTAPDDGTFPDALDRARELTSFDSWLR